MTAPGASSVAVLDYGSGNLRSVSRALERVGANVEVTTDAAQAARAMGLVVPGVGAFSACMAGIVSAGGDAILESRASSGAPTLGICVGAQILFTSGTEHGIKTNGLGYFLGEVGSVRAGRVPHMGWNTVTAEPDMALFRGIDPTARFYFVHSYAAYPPVTDSQLATCDYGEPFVAAVSRDWLSATQFHPEKSGDAGAELLQNWVRSLK